MTTGNSIKFEKGAALLSDFPQIYVCATIRLSEFYITNERILLSDFFHRYNVFKYTKVPFSFYKRSRKSRCTDVSLSELCKFKHLDKKSSLKLIVKLGKSSLKRMHSKFAQSYSLKRIVRPNVLSPLKSIADIANYRLMQVKSIADIAKYRLMQVKSVADIANYRLMQVKSIADIANYRLMQVKSIADIANYRLMHVKSIAECSKGSILQ